MQSLEDDYQVCHVGYDLYGEAVYEDRSIDNDLHNEFIPETEDVSGYPVWLSGHKATNFDTCMLCECVGMTYNDDMGSLVNHIQLTSGFNELEIHDDTYQLVVSVSTKDVVMADSDISMLNLDKWRAVLDTGATVTLIPMACAVQLGLQIMPHTDGRRVETADQARTLEI